MSDLLAAALEYAERGWPVFPCLPGGKEPLSEHGVLDATTDPEKIREWWRQHPTANVALHAGDAGLMVLDLDPDPEKPGLRTTEQVAANLRRQLPDLPETLVFAKTPRGGHHLYYTLNPRERVAPSQSKVADAVDVRSWHSYVLLPPSRTSDGVYQWIGHPALAKPAHRSDEMVRRASTVKEAHADRHVWLISADLPEHVAQAAAWLRGETEVAGRRCRVAREGIDGDNTAYETAAMCRSFGLSAETAFDLIVAHWNPRCEPPWSADQMGHLQAKVEHAYKYATSQPGNVTAKFQAAKRGMVARAFQPVARAAEAPQPSGLPEGLYDGPEYAEREEPRYLVRGLLQEASYSVASGRSQAGKSFVELSLALSIATGVPWFGADVTATGPVLYVAAEGQGRVWKDARAWCDLHQRDPRDLRGAFYIYDRSARLNTEDGMTRLGEIWEAIAARTGRSPVYCVFDTLRRNMRGGVSDEKDAAAVLEAVEMLQQSGAAVTLIAHHGKSGDDTKGVTDWQDNADQVRLYTGRVQDRSTFLQFAKIKSGTDGFGVKIEFHQRLDTLVAQADLAAILNAPEKAPEAIPHHKQAAHNHNPIDRRLKPAKPSSVDAINAAIPRVLSTKSQAYEWSDSELAAQLEHDLALNLTARTIREVYLPAIRANAACLARQLWRPNEGAKQGRSNGVWRRSATAG
jgi:hypothetical protein